MGLTRWRIAAAFVLFLAFSMPALAQEAEGPKELRILRVTPEGKDVPATRQIVIEFNRPVVPVGAMDRKADELGITITPNVECQWRWLNTTSLSCNLGEKTELALSTEYKISIVPKIAAEDGAIIAENYDHSFTTARASAGSVYIRKWLKPGLPQYRVSFNQPVTKKSVEDHLYFETVVDPVRYPVKAEKSEDDNEESVRVGGGEARDVWDVTPKEEMPLLTAVNLMQEAGLVSTEGPEASEDARELKSFYTFPEFAFTAVVCYDKNNSEVRVGPLMPQTEATLCNPMMPVRLVFNTPVMRSVIADQFKFSPDLAGGRKDYKPWGEENRDYSQLGDERTDRDREYSIGLPVGLKAAQDYTVSVKQKRRNAWEWLKSLFSKDKTPKTLLVDEFGRPLPPFELKFSTGHRSPNYEMVYKDAVLEKGIDSDVPFYVNNLTSYSFDFNYLTTDIAGSARVGTPTNVSIPAVQDVQFAVPLGVRDMLKGRSGAIYGHARTEPAVEKYEGASRLFAQVTPYQVYTKLGHYKSSVWVTDLSTGKPVEDAKVSIYVDSFAYLSSPSDVLASAQTGADGIALLPGTDEIDPSLSLSRSYKDEDARLFIRVEKGEDMALLPISYDYEVQLWNVASDVWTSSNEKFGHMKAWGMTAQGIYRAGDTMQYKIYVRDQDNNHLIAPPAGKYTLEITDPTGKSVQRNEGVEISPFGTVDGEYTIPKSAAVGWYGFKLEAVLQVDGKDVTKEFYPMSVLVSDFTPAPFRVTTELNGDLFKAGDTLDIASDAKLHSGGAYGEAAIRSTITLRSRYFSSKDPAAEGFQFDSFEGETDTEQLEQKEDKLNDKGEWKTSFTLPEKKIVFGQLQIESAVRDDRGKSVASEARADYVGVDRLVGLKPKEWVFTAGKDSVVQALVVDEKGAPVDGVKIAVDFEKEEVSTAKVKSAGNAYTNDNTVTWKKKADCSVKSEKTAQDCTFKPDSAGTWRAVATITDTKGRTHKTTAWLWVAGDGYVQWNEGREYALTLLPEKKDYKVGDTARFLLKNPYPGATAYISVERYGVLDNFVKVLPDSTPVIEIPVKADYLPGFYLSVVIVSPRVESPPPELGQVDMGKPTFRVGYIKMPVSDPYKEMVVTARADAEVYRPRDKVTVDLEAKAKHDEQGSQPIELAVAVLDESVFDLIAGGHDAFDPYKGFYDLENLDVSNYSLLTRLIGRQKFEKKGANAGGDGGDAEMRNLFKFVSYWNPSVPVDENGKAQITFDAPDNLTGWRVLAIASTKDDLMGLGEANFKVNRPTEIRPVMPNQVREGDKFEAGFSVMNRTDEKRTMKVTIEATGDLDGKRIATKEETITLEPYKRATVLMPLHTAWLPIAREVPEGTISFRATAGDAVDKDGIEHALPVLKARTIDTAATYGTTTENSISENIALPKDIYTDSGDVSVVLSPSVIANLDGAFKYMRDYIYPCWEQKISIAVMAAQYKQLKPYVNVEWKEAETLTTSILSMAADHQAPNGGMAYYTAKDEYTDPYLSAFTALVFRWLKEDGYETPRDVEEKLQTYLLNFLKNDAAPDYYQDGMISTVRAVILDALAGTGKISAQDILRFKPHVKNMSLFGKAHYMQAAQGFPEGKTAARETLGMILSAGVESGGKFSFDQTYDDGWSRILSTPIRDNCAVLDSLMDYPDNELVGDKPFKIVRMITAGRGNRDHWENTQENLFCMKALADYAKKYEDEEPDMNVTASLDGKKFGQATFEDVKDAPKTLSKPLDGLKPGSTSKLQIDRDGDGRLYYAARLRYALRKPADDVNAGMDVRREYNILKDGKWNLVKGSVEIKRGDLVKVDLFVSLPTARSFVVVNDPLPGGLETVNRDLATASSVDADQAQYDESGGSYWFKFNDWNEYNFSRWSFYHKELRHDSARFYSDWLEPGNYHLSYTAQAVATGTFMIPATSAEEMYDPDIYGRGAQGELIVEETR